MSRKSKYTYNYPDQIEMNKRLLLGDRNEIAERTGIASSTIRCMCIGVRKMPENVRKVAFEIINRNRQMFLEKLHSEA